MAKKEEGISEKGSPYQLSDVAKPCPFCGEQPWMQHWHGGGPQKRLISCDNESCLVSPQVSGATRRAALANWNYRRGEQI